MLDISRLVPEMGENSHNFLLTFVLILYYYINIMREILTGTAEFMFFFLVGVIVDNLLERVYDKIYPERDHLGLSIVFLFASTFVIVSAIVLINKFYKGEFNNMMAIRGLFSGQIVAWATSQRNVLSNAKTLIYKKMDDTNKK